MGRGGQGVSGWLARSIGRKCAGAKVDSFGDHRIAMAFAVAGLFAAGKTEIIGAESAAVSFPEFFDVLRSVTE